MIIPKHLSELLGIEYPIIQAAMAGGYVSAELTAAVSNAGGLGSIAAGYLKPEQLQTQIHDVKALTHKPFLVNLFVPHRTYVSREQMDEFVIKASDMNPDIKINEATNLYNENLWELSSIESMIDIIIAEEVPIVSFTFGVPSDDVIQRLHENNILVIGNATHLLEAYVWQEKGADALILQGSEAGGHRATFIGDPVQVAQSAFTLLQQGSRELTLPIISAGGYFDSKSMGAAFCLGASAVLVGTAFLTTHEANTTDSHRKALLNSNELDSTLTKNLSGAWARAIRTEGLKLLEQSDLSLLPFPAHGFFIKSLIAQKEPEKYRALYAGVNAQFCEEISATTLMNRWINELQCL
ncbi:NAD(P)H-dependent flavin oxidoreductase [Wohlfahrtiimonas larvae]|uniref:Propionate 3-nitronate monooxygenase n=1 Tax=Wohlfahrtiimonas larvae TaxID=1157986 RepID=A0ABP9MT83_9GAMM|nr:nitronate monooxygenase [Wohlfahrtiimonas larvae]